MQGFQQITFVSFRFSTVGIYISIVSIVSHHVKWVWKWGLLQNVTEKEKHPLFKIQPARFYLEYIFHVPKCHIFRIQKTGKSWFRCCQGLGGIQVQCPTLGIRGCKDLALSTQDLRFFFFFNSLVTSCIKLHREQRKHFHIKQCLINTTTTGKALYRRLLIALPHSP